MSENERLGQALDDLWDTIKLAIDTPTRWLLDRPRIVFAAVVFVVILMIVDFLR